jgi:hypothetical protein
MLSGPLEAVTRVFGAQAGGLMPLNPGMTTCLSKTSGRDVAGGDADPLFGQRDPFDHLIAKDSGTDLSTPRGANVKRERERNVTVNGS